MERRKTRRFARRLAVNFREAGQSKPLAGHSVDVSEGGMFIASDHVLPVGTRLRMEIQDGDRTCLVEAVVVNVRSVPGQSTNGMGVRFLLASELILPFLRRSGETEITVEPSLADGVYEFRFTSAAHLARVLNEEISRGFLFLETTRLEPIDREVTVSFLFPEPAGSTPALAARVVHRSEAVSTASTAFPVGIGVQFVDRPTTLAILEAAAARLTRRQDAG